jgi:hypothetical protein
VDNFSVMFSDRTLQLVCIIGGVLLIVLAAGYVVRASWVTTLWPWPDSRLSYIFIGAIIAAVAAALIWIGFAHEWGAIAAGALNLTVTASGMSVFLFQLSTSTGQQSLLGYAVGAALFVLFNIALFVWSRRYPIRDPRPTPLFVRVSFIVFVTVLLATGAALLVKIPNVMPWPLKPETSVMFAWIYVGDALYFIYALAYPRWHNARAQLWSFLVYDAVLLPPLLPLTSTVPPERSISLAIYLAVLVYSAAVALYYLLLNKETRRHQVT